MQHLKNSSDATLLRMLGKGNSLAFQQVYLNYWESLYAYAVNILNDRALAEDVLHEVFMQVWAKRATLKVENLKPYLFNAVRNKALTKIRDDKFTTLDEALISRLDLIPEVERAFDRIDTTRAIQEAAQKLPARCRTIFYMNKFQEYSVEEIAVHFNISTRTVHNQLSLALKHLREELGAAVFLALLFPFH